MGVACTTECSTPAPRHESDRDRRAHRKQPRRMSADAGEEVLLTQRGWALGQPGEQVTFTGGVMPTAASSTRPSRETSGASGTTPPPLELVSEDQHAVTFLRASALDAKVEGEAAAAAQKEAKKRRKQQRQRDRLMR